MTFDWFFGLIKRIKAYIFKIPSADGGDRVTMGQGYRRYAEAAANRRRDETTIYDPVTGLYRKVKVFPQRFNWGRNRWR